MWDRARTAATAGLDRLHRRDRTTTTDHLHHKQRLSCIDDADSGEDEAYYYSTDYQLDFASFNNALGIAGLRNRDEDDENEDEDEDEEDEIDESAVNLTTPRLEISPTSIPVEDAAPSSPIFEPPPRNPRRLLRQFLPAPLFHEPESITDSETTSTSDGDGYSSSPASNFKLASGYSYGRPALEQISPPSSPDVAAVRDGHLAGDVSPIDDDTDFFQQSFIEGIPPKQTSIPQYHQSSVAIPQHNYYSSRDGAAGQTFTGSRPVESSPASQSSLPRSNKMSFSSIDKPSGQPMSHRRQPSNGTSPSFGQRIRFLGRSKNESLDYQPLLDPSNATPLNIPRRSSKRVSARIISAPIPITSPPDSEKPFSDRDLLPSKLNPNPYGTPSSKLQFPAQHISGAQGLPSPPHYDFPAPPSNAMTQSARAPSPFGLDSTPSAVSAIRRKPPQSTNKIDRSNMPHPLNSSPVYLDTLPRRASASVATPPSTEKTWKQPQSRFSVTTFAPSNPATPQQPADSQVPAVGPQQVNSTGHRTSLLSGRDTPDVSRMNPIVIPIRGPFWPGHEDAPVSENPSKYRTHSRTSSSPNPTSPNSSSRRASTSKPLPLAPPELSTSDSDDQITQLNVRLASLAHRRVNIIRSIKQMTELMPKDNLMASEEVLRKREIEKLKVEGLKQELSEIQREEYELGLKLYRAYKRQDKDAVYEPTTLWVRRVTS